jgi:RHS repeat-associated protein
MGIPGPGAGYFFNGPQYGLALQYFEGSYRQTSSVSFLSGYYLGAFTLTQTTNVVPVAFSVSGAVNPGQDINYNLIETSVIVADCGASSAQCPVLAESIFTPIDLATNSVQGFGGDALGGLPPFPPNILVTQDSSGVWGLSATVTSPTGFTLTNSYQGVPGTPDSGWIYTFGSVSGIYNLDMLTSTAAGKTNGPTCEGAGQTGQTNGGCDPINLGTGNLFEQVADYQTAGPNKLGFIRYYNSSSLPTKAASLGTNWRSTFDRYLIVSSSTSVLVESADGRQLGFFLNNGIWHTDSDVDLALANAGSTWIVTDSDDTIETYKAGSGQVAYLASIQARNGYTQKLAYNSANQLTSVTDSYGRMLTFTYSSGLLQTVTTPDNLVLTYGYNSSGTTAGVLDRLTSVTYSTTPQSQQSYLYENSSFPFALTGIIDEDGNRYNSWTFDSSGRAMSSQHGSGADLRTIAYNADGSVTVTNPLGEQDIYKFATLQGVLKVVEIDRVATSTTLAAKELFTYDANGYKASETDWNGNLTTFVNDIHGQPITINEAVGTAAARTTTITYDSAFIHLPQQKVTSGLTTSFTYDTSGEVLTQTLTDTTTNTVPHATGGQTRTWTYSWANSLLTSVLGPRTDVKELTTFTYDNTGALTATTNALGQTTKITQHLAGGLPQTVIDPNGVTTNLSYDTRQRLTSSAVTTAAGVLTTKYAYDFAGNLLTTTLPDGSALTNGYDAAHRLTSVTDLFKQSITYTLDALGDRTQANVLDATGKVQRKHSGVFDVLGRTLQDIGGVGQTSSFTFDANGNTLTATDPLNNVTTQTFDSLNRPVTTTDANGNVTATVYDAHDRPISVTDPNGGTTTYTYDGFGELIQQASPVTGTTVFHYDPAGNLTQRIDARGVIANYTSDALDRPSATTYPAGPAENITYNYDQPGHGFGSGRLTSLKDAAGTLNRSYDERGDIVSEIRTLGNVTLATTYSYDAAQRTSSIGYPSGWTASYARDAMGRITGVSTKGPASTSQTAPVLSGIAYQPFGPPNAVTYGNGIAESRVFDADYRLTSLVGTGKNPLQNLNYAFDQANNVNSIQDRVTPGNSQSFGYDPLNRLTTASGAYGQIGYRYDALGNRLTESDSVAPTSLDGLGNLTAMTYNQTGRVSSVTAGTQQIAGYTYDALGHRLARTGTSAMLYQYDLGGRLLEEDDAQGNPQADYLYLGSQPIASISPASGKVYFLHDDRLGTPQVATDANQTIAWSASYQPFGTTSTGVGLISQDLRLPGQEYDSIAGWNHNGFREYVPGWGRYSQSDPIGIATAANTYSYGISDPLNHLDPSGLYSILSPDQIEQILASATRRAATVETVGLGPENPFADFVAAVVFTGTVVIGLTGDTPTAEAPGLPASLQGVTLTTGRTNQGDVFYHYSCAPASSFANGLTPPTAWATPLGNLTGTQAQKGLSLSANRPPPSFVYTVTPIPGTVYKYNPSALPLPGVPGTGGLPEIWFPYGTGPGTVSGQRQIQP